MSVSLPASSPVSPEATRAVQDSVAELGEREAFSVLYQAQYGPLVRLVTLLIGNRSDAQDITQEAFARWFVHRSSVEHPEAYLRTTAINLTRGRFRRLGITRKYAPVLEADARQALGTDVPDVLMDVIAKLPDRQRIAVLLRYYEGRSEAEIAEIMNCPPGTVKSHLSRALHEMGRVIER
jgi:RNA polymerase sigma factor (sigma-70 family)